MEEKNETTVENPRRLYENMRFSGFTMAALHLVTSGIIIGSKHYIGGGLMLLACVIFTAVYFSGMPDDNYGDAAKSIADDPNIEKHAYQVLKIWAGVFLFVLIFAIPFEAFAIALYRR